MQSILQAFLSQTAPDGGAASGPGGIFGNGLVLLPIFILVFYFLMWRPQSRERKRQQEWLSRMQKGEEVVLQSGIIGVIHSVEDRVVVLDVGGGNKLRVLKAQVAGQYKVAPAQPAKAEAKK
jgi:preprotein translocase subunit YajC